MSGKLERRLKIKAHIRHKVSGTTEKPRLTVFRSNSQIYCQIIDDLAGKTLASASSLSLKDKITKTEQAAKVGEIIAKAAQESGITTVIFDLTGYLYHCRFNTLVEFSRNGWLKFYSLCQN